MKMLNVLLENEGIQAELANNEDKILEASILVGQFPEVIKEYIAENMSEFIGDTIQETYSNMHVFTESATRNFMQELVNQM